MDVFTVGVKGELNGIRAPGDGVGLDTVSSSAKAVGENDLVLLATTVT